MSGSTSSEQMNPLAKNARLWLAWGHTRPGRVGSKPGVASGTRSWPRNNPAVAVFLNSPDCRAVFGVNAEAAEFNQFEQPFVNQSR
jgi:hypothetical protein